MVSPSNFDIVGFRLVVEQLEPYLRSLTQVIQANNRVEKSVTDAAKAATRHSHTFDGIAKGAVAAALGVGALSVTAQVIRGIFAGTVGAAIEFEDSFAGIRKTVDGTEEDFAKLAQANRDMAKTIPISVNELNRLGEAGGALGVEGVDNILAFEKVTADLAATTNLTSEAAAAAVAKLSNIFEAPITEADRLGSALVDLGNKGASTETQIANFSLRIGAAGKIAGLTIDQVAGVGSAFASAGNEAEAGGTAISQMLVKITQAAAEGGDNLETFARTAGVTAEQFKQLVAEDPGEAFTKFVEGLGAAGTEAFNILDDLGAAGARSSRAFLSVAQSGDLLRTSLETASTAFQENTALTIEAEKRYATTASQLKILQNQFTDVGISVASRTLPGVVAATTALGELLDVVGPLADSALPSLITGLLATVGVLAAFRAVNIAVNVALASQAFIELAAGIRSTAAATQLLSLVGLTPMTAALGALAVAVIGLDVALRATGHGGLLDFITGADAAKKRAAELAAEIKFLNDVIAEGPTRGEGISRAIDIEVDRLVEAQRNLNAKIAEFERAGLSTNAKVLDDDRQRIEDSAKAILELLESATLTEKRQILFELRLTGITFEDEDLNKAIQEQVFKLADLDAKFGVSTANLLGFNTAQGLTAEQAKAMADALAATEAGIESYGEAIDEAFKALEDRIDPTITSLRLQKDALDRQRASMVDGSDAANAMDIRIEALQNTIDHFTGQADTSRLAVEAYAAGLQAAGLEFLEAARPIAEVTRLLDELPEEERIEVQTIIDQGDLARVYALLDLIRRGATLPVAIQFSGQAGAALSIPPLLRSQKSIDLLTTLGFDEFNTFIPQVTQNVNDLVAAEEEQGTAAAALAAGSDKAAKTIDRLTAVLSAVSDGTVSLSEKLQLGLTDQQIVVLELEVARQQEAEAAHRASIEFQKLAKVLTDSGMTAEAFQLAIALQAIAEELERTGETVTEFLHEIASSALEEFQSALDKLFGNQTREDKEFELQLRQKELERSRRKRAGATDEELEAIDEEIQQMRDTISIRRQEKEIIKLKAELEDATLLSDQDQLTQSQLLTIAIREQSEEVKALNGALFLEVFAHLNAANAANEAADAFRRWIIEGERQRLERGEVSAQDFFDNLPSGPGSPQENLAKLLEELARQGKLAGGGLVMGPTRAMLGEGGLKELVLPLESPKTRQILATMPFMPQQQTANNVAFAPTINNGQPQTERELRRILHGMVDEMLGSARIRGQRSGAPVSSGIG